jgi:hypothetical protein
VRRRAALAWALGLAAGGCSKPATPGSTLLDREFDAYRAERETQRLDDLRVRASKARADADRVEAELAATNERLRALRSALSEAKGEERRAASEAAPPAAPPPSPAGPAAP